MCGIAGFTGKPNETVLRKMNTALAHRGPDGEGFFVNGKTNLGMRRLAIIDLKTGDQPMFSEDKEVAVVFNGEIYNFQDLKPELEKAGHKFQTHSDTEVIVHGYEEWGTGLFEKFNGMFAIAIWDEQEKKLILARDRMGKKPLYFSVADGEIVFGSEIKALLQHPRIKKELSLDSLNLYLSYEYVPGPLTIYKNIYKLEPGSLLVWQNSGYQITKYWNIDFRRIRRDKNEGEYITEFGRALDDAVRMRLISDVPLGVFLSGGIDSGAIAYYAQKNSLQKIKTFSIGFDDASFDESQFARTVAKHLGTEHYERRFSEKEVLDLLPEVLKLQDEPFGDASLFPTHLLSKFARKQVTVALAGDGGDELLYGYPTFQMHKISEYYFKLPKLIRKNILSRVIQSLPTSFNNITLEYGLKRFDASTEYAPWQRDLIWIGSFDPGAKTLLLKESAFSQIDLKKTFQPLERHLHEVQGEQFLDQISFLYLNTYLVDDILHKTDRASMYASLEARDPFLDYRVVDLLTGVPPDLKMKGLCTKYLLKKLMTGKLPEQIINRKKKGFGIPVARWLVGELKSLVQEHLLDRSFIEQQGLFDYDYLVMLYNQHEQKKKNNRKELWTLLMFQLWYKNWLK